MIRLSGVPSAWEEAQRAVNRVAELVRAHGREFRLAWVVEQNPRGTGRHVHAFAHGDPVDDVLGEAARRAALGSSVHVQPVTHTGGLGYVFKEAVHSRESLRVFLGANGGRLVHSSHGYWRNGPGGEPLALRAAERLARSSAEPRASQWVRVPRAAPGPSDGEAAA
jgi:hypothetical protein